LSPAAGNAPAPPGRAAGGHIRRPGSIFRHPSCSQGSHPRRPTGAGATNRSSTSSPRAGSRALRRGRARTGRSQRARLTRAAAWPPRPPDRPAGRRAAPRTSRKMRPRPAPTRKASGHRSDGRKTHPRPRRYYFFFFFLFFFLFSIAARELLRPHERARDILRPAAPPGGSAPPRAASAAVISAGAAGPIAPADVARSGFQATEAGVTASFRSTARGPQREAALSSRARQPLPPSPQRKAPPKNKSSTVHRARGSTEAFAQFATLQR